MLDITKDIQSLTTFRRRSGDFMKQLKKSKRPVVLTVKGKAAAIVQDAEAYQRLLDIAAREEAVYALANYPRRCHVATEARKLRRELRHLHYGKKPHVYRVIYEVDESRQTVWVLTVRHGATRKLKAADVK